MNRSILALSSLLVLASCTWVQTSPEAQRVRVLTPEQVSSCSRLGTTTSTTSDRVLIVPRGSEKVQDELVDLARNEAVLMGGNAIVATSIVDDGRQHFVVYNCP